jgi:putative ABC transport system ATP-binding protein
MFDSYLLSHVRHLKLTRNYFFLAFLYGLSTLMIPFAVQLLVNNLSLAGLWVSTLTFLILITLGLGMSLVVKYGQLILVEFVQRRVLQKELQDWYAHRDSAKYGSAYYFEMFKMLKSFAGVFGEMADFFLTLIFGFIALIFIHPAFLAIGLLFAVALFVIRFLGTGAVKSSIEVSNAKYELFFSLPRRDQEEFDSLSLEFFKNRESHFGFIKRQAIVVFFSYLVLQVLLLSWGIHLIEVNQLSIGQLVSAEIISSGIFLNFVKLPKLMESFYDFETSCYKLDYAKGVKSHE